jgi:hypothetical protein
MGIAKGRACLPQLVSTGSPTGLAIVVFVASDTPSATAVREYVQGSSVQLVATDEERPFTLTLSEEHLSVLRTQESKSFVSQYMIEGQHTEVKLVRR